jgi:hypothetical protein
MEVLTSSCKPTGSVGMVQIDSWRRKRRKRRRRSLHHPWWCTNVRVKPGSTLTEVHTRLILLVILQLLMNTMCLNDILKRSDNLLNINLDTRKSSFVEEVVDNFY